jgi:hypothetical protein
MIRAGRPLSVLAALLLAAPLAAQAAPIVAQGPAFPTPHGPSGFSFSGPIDDMGMTGGLELTLSGFDFGTGRAFWWGPTKDMFSTGPGVGAALDGAIDSAGESLTYVGGGVWTGTSTIDLVVGGPTSVDVRYTATIVMNGSAFFDASEISASTSVTPAVSEITGDPFKVNHLMEARFTSVGGAYTPLIEFFEAQTTASGNTVMSVQGGLYYTPEPTTFLMLGLGMAGLAGMGSRRRAA